MKNRVKSAFRKLNKCADGVFTAYFLAITDVVCILLMPFVIKRLEQYVDELRGD